jgi:glutathione S-transferase
MRLYYSPGACSLAPHIVAREAGVPVELIKVDLASKTIPSGRDYLQINPNGTVPMLAMDDGLILTEGAVVSQFIADMEPEAKLMPPFGTLDRYRALEWLNFIGTELHKGFSPLFHKDTPPEMRTIVKAALAVKLTYLDSQLARRDYLMNGGFSAPDAYAFTILSWAPVVGIRLAEWPNLTAYVARIAARPNVRAALEAEGLVGKQSAQATAPGA